MYGRIFRKGKEKVVKGVKREIKKEVVKETKKSAKKWLPLVVKAAVIGLSMLSLAAGVVPKALPGPSVVNIYNGPVTMIHA